MDRRSFLTAVSALLVSKQALARMSMSNGQAPLDNSAATSPDILISYGQSWRVNAFDSFASPFRFNQQSQTLLALHSTNVGSPIFGPGPLQNSAGISFNGTLNGFTGYASTDVFSVGRTSVLAQQLERQRRGITLVPIIEFCAGFPASFWTFGGGGGLAPGATCTASVTNDVMTVTSVASGTLVVNQQLSGSGFAANSMIVSFGTGSGGTGTYNIAVGQITANGTTFHTASAVFVGFISNGFAANGNILNVTSVTSGSISVGDTITSGAVSGTKIANQIDGTPGGVGTYTVSVGSPQNISSETINAQGISWTNQGRILTAIGQLLPQQKWKRPTYRWVGYTQGPSTDSTVSGKISDLTDMLTQYDSLNLEGAGTTGMRYVLALPSATSNATIFPASVWGTYVFCRTNAPGQGGQWSGRCFAGGPSYPWAFIGTDNIHTGDYGTARWGEIEGYIRCLVQDLGVSWTPLWRDMSSSITTSGQNVIIPFSRPAGPDFVSANMKMQSDALDGIKVWPNYGFNVNRASVPLTITNVTIDGLNVVLTVSERIFASNMLEVSYAWYGPGGPNPGPNSGVGGNLVMNGPASLLFPGNTIDAWAWPFIENITV